MKYGDYEEKVPYRLEIPRLSCGKHGAEKWNREYAEKIIQNRRASISVYEKKENEKGFYNYSAVLTYEYKDLPDFTVITTLSSGGLWGSGAGYRTYNSYYYDKKNDKMLTHDEFLKAYTNGKYDLDFVIGYMNEHVFVRNEDLIKGLVAKSEITAIIPRPFDEPNQEYGATDTPDFDVCSGEYWSSRLYFHEYETLRVDAGDGRITEYTYRVLRHKDCDGPRASLVINGVNYGIGFSETADFAIGNITSEKTYSR